MKIVGLFLCFFSTGAFAASASDPAWLALLHFKGARSSISQGEFFLDPNGARDAAAELLATEAFFASNPEAPCRYPARALYLKWEKPGKGELCEKWQKWAAAVSPKGIELVFASAFLNSPASMYGHTMLKFPRSGKTEGEELLDYTLNYGANPGNATGVVYAYKGLSGGFNGYFTTAPFFIKVKEYNFVENRDFWIYPIQVNDSELKMLLAHGWEIRSAALPYYFLKKNCSYYLLEFLEVARPGLNLTSSFPLWAVPLDTIRVLQKHGLVSAPRFKPSRAKILEAEWKQLSGSERSAVEKLAQGQEVALAPGREAAQLDAAYDLWKYRFEAKREADPAIENKLLAARGKFKEPMQTFTFREVAPENGHRTSRLGLVYGQDWRSVNEHYSQSGSFAEIQYRGTFHDLLAPSEGYEKYSELTMGDIRARFEKKRIFLDRVDILRIRALSPRSEWFPRFAWGLKFAYDRAKEFQCRDWKCGRALADGGGGISVELGPVLLFALAEGDAEIGGIFDPNYRLAVGPTGGIFMPLWKGGRLLAEGEYRWRVLGEKFQRRPLRAGFAQSFGVNWEVRAAAETNRGYREASFGLFHYF